MTMDVKTNYERWLNSPRVSAEDKKLLRSLSQEQIDDAFFKNAEFGTGGLRGVLGPGTNRVNVHTVGRISVGFAQYLLSRFPKGKAEEMGIAISHDNRFMSREFTLLAADIFNRMGHRHDAVELHHGGRALNGMHRAEDLVYLILRQTFFTFAFEQYIVEALEQLLGFVNIYFEHGIFSH